MGKNGGKRQNAGRPPKAKEIELIERLSPFEDYALEALRNGVESGQYQFVKLYFEYRFGKPKESVSLNFDENFVQVTKKIIGGKD